MTLLINSYNHKLRFKIDADAPKKYLDRWNLLKQQCEYGFAGLKHIVNLWTTECKLERNKELPYLNRSEGGIGGDNNLINKQIRFRGIVDIASFKWCIKPDNDIVMSEIYSTETEKWTYEELNDLIKAFIKMANIKMQAKCVRGYIEMYDRTYEDTDSD